jgi:hypothetical protein
MKKRGCECIPVLLMDSVGRNYQRLFRRPPPPPLSRRRSPPPPPPPPPPPRRSWASLTRMDLPSSSRPSISWMAVWASAAASKVTNPKPRERPVSRSVITLASTTGPNRSNAAQRLASEVSQLRPPTKILFDTLLTFCFAPMALFWQVGTSPRTTLSYYHCSREMSPRKICAADKPPRGLNINEHARRGRGGARAPALPWWPCESPRSARRSGA